MTMWPKVVLFNYFAVPMPFADKATALRLPLDWVSSAHSGLLYGRPHLTDQEWRLRIAQRRAERTKRSVP